MALMSVDECCCVSKCANNCVEVLMFTGEFDNAGAMMTVDETLMCSFQVCVCVCVCVCVWVCVCV